MIVPGFYCGDCGGNISIKNGKSIEEEPYYSYLFVCSSDNCSNSERGTEWDEPDFVCEEEKDDSN